MYRRVVQTMTNITSGNWKLLECGHYSEAIIEVVERKLWAECALCWPVVITGSTVVDSPRENA